MDHTDIIKERLSKGLKNPEIRTLVLKDFAFTFQELGLDGNVAKDVAEQVILFIENSVTLKETENKVIGLFEATKAGDNNLLQLVKLGLNARFDKIFEQIKPYLKGSKGKVFDYGMGAGGLTQKLKDELGLDIEGGDVRDFRAPRVTVPFVMLADSADSQGRIVDVADKYYEAAILTNVIHHEKVNQNILKELNRIAAKKLVIIETVPVGTTAAALALDHERTFANDVLWNRFFNHADIPVPGTYETPEDWIKRFESFGWKNTHSEDLGFDQKTINDVHHLLVFER